MKKILFTVVFLSVAFTLNGAPLLVEKYQEGQITIPAKENNTLTVASIQFSVDSACLVQFVAGGFANLAKLWLVLDGDSLPPVPRIHATVNSEWVSVSYSYLVMSGNHTLDLKIQNLYNIDIATTCQNAYLQALIFLPDSASAVAEQPAPETGRPVTSAVISRGPYVSAPGASAVVDATGRVMENVLRDGKVQISNLPAGTYYAKDEEHTVVKIVKIN